MTSSSFPEFEMTNRVPVWAEIKHLTTMAYYLPLLPIGGDAYITGNGPRLESLVVFEFVSLDKFKENLPAPWPRHRDS